MIDLIIIAAANFITVFALGLQSRNVNGGHYAWAAGTSIAISLSQLTMLQRVVAPDAGAAQLVVCCVSAATAITTSMWFHQRFVARRSSPCSGRTPA